MSEPIIIALIAVIPPMLIALLAVYTMYQVKGKVDDLHIIVNSRLTEILRLTAVNAHATGVKEEQDRNKSGKE